MSDFPFSLTLKAAAAIEKTLLDAQREPEVLALATILEFSPNALSGYLDGDIYFAWAPYEVVMTKPFLEMKLVGFKVFVHIRTLKRLIDKRIDLKEGKGGKPRVVAVTVIENSSV